MSTLFPLYRIGIKLVLDAHINLYLLIFLYNYFFKVLVVHLCVTYICNLLFKLKGIIIAIAITIGIAIVITMIIATAVISFTLFNSS